MDHLEQQLPDMMAGLPARLHELVARRATEAPDHLALIEAGGSWSYQELDAAVTATRAWLVEQGVRGGDRVMLVNENCRAVVALLLAVTSLDAWIVMVSARLSDSEIDQIRDHCAPRRILYTTDAAPRAAAQARRHGAAMDVAAPCGRIAVGPLDPATLPEPVEAASDRQVAVLIYTSGTTGLPKGVMLTHRNLLYMAAISGATRALTPADRLYGVLPLSHIVGLSVVLLGTLTYGATLQLAPRFDPGSLLDALAHDGVTVLLGAPSMYGLLADYAAKKSIARLACPALRVVNSSGAPLDLATKAATEALFGLKLHNGYGITECAPTISQARLDEPREDTSVGRLLAGVEARLIGRDGAPVAAGEVGELWVRGPNVMKGYYRAPDETAAVLDDEGWFNTRDLARFEGGHLFIAGRTKELIIRFGFNIYPPEVEAVLNAHPAVLRSAVVGRPAEGTEEVVAFVELAPGMQATPDELSTYAATRLAPYKRPAAVILMPSLPTTASGKIRKVELAALAAAPSG
jgi:acyl-CoA synthetase (AMP-forming)/AMP-acid ligase II